MRGVIKKNILSFLLGNVTCLSVLLILAYWGSPFNFIKDWQTLIAGMLAFIGAYLTVQTMWQQEKDRIYRRSLTLRSELPDAVSHLLSYLQECMLFIYDDNEYAPDGNEYRQPIQVLRNNIEYSDSDTAESLFKIISFYQVHNARLHSHFNRDPGVIQYPEDMALDIIKLTNYLHQLFDYARNEISTFVLDERASIDDRHHSFRQLVGIMNFDHERYDRLNQLFNSNQSGN